MMGLIMLVMITVKITIIENAGVFTIYAQRKQNTT